MLAVNNDRNVSIAGRRAVVIAMVITQWAFTAGDVLAAERTFRPEEFGAVGDCNADDTNAFVSMRNSMLSIQAADTEDEVSFVVDAPPGRCYQYTNNRWTWGIKRLKLKFHGSAIQNVSKSPWNEDKYPLYTNRSPFETIGYDAEPYATPLTFGDLIATALKGDNSIRLLDPQGAPYLHPGDWVLIYSYDQQFSGYPPNARFYDYARVVETRAATITLDRPLTADHLATYPELLDAKGSIGRARILKLGRDVPFAVSLEIEGIRTLPNPNITNSVASNYLLVANALRVSIAHSQLVSFVPSIVEDIVVTDSTITYTEPDKLIDHVRFERCKIDSAGGATGVKVLEIVDSHVSGSYFALNPRTMVISGSVLDSAVKSVSRWGAVVGANLFSVPTRSLTITNSKLNGRLNLDDRYVKDPGAQAIVVDDINASLSTDGSALTVLLTRPEGQRFLSCIDIGRQVFISSPDPSARDLHATVTGVSGDGQTKAHVQLVSESPITGGATITCYGVGSLVMTHNEYPGWRVAMTGFSYPGSATMFPRGVATVFEDQVDAGRGVQIYTLNTQDGVGQSFWIDGVVTEMTVSVRKRYSGPGPLYLNIVVLEPAKGVITEVIDLSHAGSRVVNISHWKGAAPGDQLEGVGEHYVQKLQAYYSSAPLGLYKNPNGTDFQQAWTTLRFKYTPASITFDDHRNNRVSDR